MPLLPVWYVYISSTSRSMCRADPPGATYSVFICTQRRELCHSDVEGPNAAMSEQRKCGCSQEDKRGRGLGVAMWVPVWGQKWQTSRCGLTREQSSNSRGDCRLGWDHGRICSPNALTYTAVNRIGGVRGVDSKRAQNKTEKQCLNRVWRYMVATPLLGHQRHNYWVIRDRRNSGSHL